MGNDLKTVWSAKDLIMGGLAYTVMGILIVFLILIIIMAVIKAMAVISGERKPKKQASPAKISTQSEVKTEPVTEKKQDESELIAVITAAIASMIGQTASGLVVRSYKKVDGDAWNKAGRMDILDNRL